MVEWKSHLQRAIQRFGSQGRLAAAMSCFGEKYQQNNVSSWVASAVAMPPQAALDVHRATEGAVSAFDLRPDLWPTQAVAEIAAAQIREPERVAS